LEFIMRLLSIVLPTRLVLALLMALGLSVAACGQSPTTKSEQTAKPATQQGVRIRTVSPDFSVAPQFSVEDIKRAAAEGYTLVINNRPDGEGGPDQPTSAELAKAAKAAGIDYRYIPFRSGHVPEEALTQMQNILQTQNGKTVAFCRSGTRAVTLWAMAQSDLGTRSPEQAIEAAKKAGYNLERQRERLDTLAASAKP
jgi:sulfide:quinone oxidoreductase